MVCGPEGLSRYIADESNQSIDFRGNVTHSMKRRYETFALLRLAICVLVGVSEIIALGIAIDTGDLASKSTWWTPIIERSPQLLQILISSGVVAGFWVLAGFGGERYTFSNTVSLQHFTIHILANLFSFILFVSLTRALFAGVATDWFAEHLLLYACVGLGLFAALSLALSLLSLAEWSCFLLRARWILLAAATVGALAWLVGQMASQSWSLLANGTFSLVRLMLSFVYDDVEVDPAQLTLGTSRFRVSIAPACSGYEGLGLIGVFLTVFCAVFRQRLRFPRVLLLYPIGFVAIWLLNAVRIAMLVVIGTDLSPQVAAGGFHSQAGWLFFNFVAIGLVLTGTRARFFARDQRETQRSSVNFTACFLSPFLAAIFIGMVIATVSLDADAVVQPLSSIIAAGAFLYLMRKGLQNVRWGFSWKSIALGVFVYGLWIFFVNATSTPEARISQLNAHTNFSASMVLRVCSYVIFTPIIEELAFRGFLMRRVISEEFENASLRPAPIFAIAISSILFGVFHGENWFPGIVAGIVFAFAYVRVGSLGDSVAAHSTTNGLLAVHATITGNLAVWS